MDELDSVDIRLLDALQADASLSNQALAARVAVSPATSRFTRRRQVAGDTATRAARAWLLSDE